MKVTVPKGPAEGDRLDLLVLALSHESWRRRRQHAFARLDRLLGGLLSRLAKAEDFAGKADQVLLLHSHDRLPAARVALLGLGATAALGLEELRRLGARAISLGEGCVAARVGLLLPSTAAAEDAAAEAVVEGATLAGYRFQRYLSKRPRDPGPRELRLFGAAGLGAATRRGVVRGRVSARAVALARDLVNEPASSLTPSRMAQAARREARGRGVQVRVLGPREIAKERMRLVEAVAAGSREPPRIIRLAYRGARRPRCRVTLVGKGITFDAGGLDLKAAANMLEQKTDMAGAAAVLGAVTALAERRSPVHVTAYLACSENMLGGGAYKPGDIIRSRAGLSVEIGNTDAEGRLILADTLSLAGRERSDVMIDVATLTGACMVALGPLTAGLFTDDDELAQLLLEAGRDAGEDLWRLPLTAALNDQLKSPIADLKNVGGRYGGAITAALFLRAFVPKGVRWAHLDIAGPARTSSERAYTRKGGTGFGVRTLVRAVEALGG